MNTRDKVLDWAADGLPYCHDDDDVRQFTAEDFNAAGRIAENERLRLAFDEHYSSVHPFGEEAAQQMWRALGHEEPADEDNQ